LAEYLLAHAKVDTDVSDLLTAYSLHFLPSVDPSITAKSVVGRCNASGTNLLADFTGPIADDLSDMVSQRSFLAVIGVEGDAEKAIIPQDAAVNEDK
jgi:hypothetical protein